MLHFKLLANSLPLTKTDKILIASSISGGCVIAILVLFAVRSNRKFMKRMQAKIEEEKEKEILIENNESFRPKLKSTTSQNSQQSILKSAGSKKNKSKKQRSVVFGQDNKKNFRNQNTDITSTENIKYQ